MKQKFYSDFRFGMRQESNTDNSITYIQAENV